MWLTVLTQVGCMCGVDAFLNNTLKVSRSVLQCSRQLYLLIYGYPLYAFGAGEILFVSFSVTVTVDDRRGQLTGRARFHPVNY